MGIPGRFPEREKLGFGQKKEGHSRRREQHDKGLETHAPRVWGRRVIQLSSRVTEAGCSRGWGEV